MGKTIDVAADRAFDQTKTVLPAEVARGVFMRNAPSLQALKLMHLMIGTAGGRMADDVRHSIRLADIRGIEGMKNHDRTSIQPLFEELRAVVMTYDDKQTMQITIGGLIDHAVLDYRNETSGEVLVSWYFGRMFRDMAAKSNHWAILDRQTVFHLGSKYSVMLFQHIASLANLDYVTSKVFTVPELRALFGVAEGKIKRFANLKKDVLDPAIEEINHLSRLKLKATPKKMGRTITEIEISWKVKPDPSAAKRELNSSKTGRKNRREGTTEQLYEPFPSEGTIHYTKWQQIAREHLPAPTPDLAVVSNSFRQFAKDKGIGLSANNIEKIFVGFCQKYSL